MKLRKYLYCMIGALIFSTIILTNRISKSNVESQKTLINYDNKKINEELQDSNGGRVRISDNDSNGGVIYYRFRIQANRSL